MDSIFDKSCLDCAGIPFGNASLDACNQCLSQDDTERCTSDNILYIPNVFSPNGDGINDLLKIGFKQGVEGAILEYSIYSRWGELIYRAKGASVRSNDIWWDGRANGRKLPSGVYVYHLRLALTNGEILDFAGDVTLVR